MEPQEKLQKMKKLGKIFRIVSLVAGIAIALMFVFFCLAPAMRLTTDIGKYAKGYNYYGWQLIFKGCGYPPLAILCMFEEQSTVAGDYVPNTWDFDFNFWTFFGLILPLIALIVCGIVSVKMKNRGKAVCEFVMGGSILLGAILLLCCGALSVNVATDMGAGVGFKNQYLLPAIEAGTYKTQFYPIFLFVMALLVALFKVFRGLFLLYQRKYALDNKPVLN